MKYFLLFLFKMTVSRVKRTDFAVKYIVAYFKTYAKN